MIFQLAYSGSAQGLIATLQQWGFLDLVVPFILIFAILFAILTKLPIFSGDEGKKYNTIISIAIALLIVIPHSLNPQPNDAVNVINRFLPEFVFITIAMLILLMLMGLVGGAHTATTGPLVGIAALIAVIYLGIVIISALSPTGLPFRFLSDPNFQALIIVILVFGLVIWYITKKDTAQGQEWTEWIKKLFGG